MMLSLSFVCRLFHLILNVTRPSLDRPRTFHRRRPAVFRPFLEPLEDRTLLSTDTWTSLTGGNWSSTSNWSLQALPGVNDNAVIPTLNSGASITYPSGTNTINSLTLGANLTLAAGSALTINSYLTLQPSVTLTDNGTLTFFSGDTVTFANYYGSTQQLVVGSGGLLNAASTTFAATGGTAQINVNNGGHLQASNSTFASSLNQVELNSGSVLNAGDLTGNSFNCPLFLPATDVQYLSSNGSNTNAAFQDIDILAGTFSSGTLALNAIGSSSSLLYLFPGNFTVAAGATLNVAANLPVQIQPSVTLTDNGTLTFASGDTVTFANYYGSTQQLVVGTGGLLNAASTTFAATGGTAQINVNSGGHLQAIDDTFASSLNQVELNSGSVLNANDLTGDSFNCPLFLPATDVQYLSSNGSNTNAAFQDIDILAGTFSSGTLALNAIGSSSSLLYLFPGNFTVAAGAKLNVAANLPVQIQPSVTLTDNGTLTFASGDTVTFANYYGSTQQLVVGSGGLLNAASTTFAATGGTAQINVNSGGHLQASNSTFASSLNQVELNSGSVLNAGDLTGNSFNCPLFLPAPDVQYLSSSSNLNTNAAFQDIDILAGTFSSGTLALNAIGSSSSLLYLFPGNFTVAAGAKLNVAANLPVQIQPSVTLTDNGTLTFASGDTVTFANYYGSTQQLVVGSGGLLNAASTTFAATGGTAQINVNSGGHLQASNSTFASSLNQILLNNGSILHAGDLTDNSFNCPLFLPATEVQYLSSSGSNTNAQFQDIDILAGTLSSGQTLTLNAIGLAPTLLYLFPGNFTVAAGATLNVAANLPVQIQPSATLTDDGTLTFASGDTVTFANYYGSTQQLVVGSGGLLNAADMTFTPTGGTSLLNVNSGGHIQAIDDTFALTNVTLGAASAGTIQFDTFTSQLVINSGTMVTIIENDLSNVPGNNNGILAVGSPTTINLTNNYWGTTIVSQIDAKIRDHNNPTLNTTLPTVNFTPLLSNPPLTIIPGMLPVATVGNPYSVQLTAGGGSGGGYTFTTAGFPSWLTLSSDNVLQGTPTTAGTYSFQVKVTDSSSERSSLNYTMKVDPALVVSPATLPIATVGDNFKVQLTATGGSGMSYGFTSTSLPDWLSLSPSGLLTGIPQDDSSSPVSIPVTVTDSNNGTGARSYSLTIDPALTISPTTMPVATVGNSLRMQLTAAGGSGHGYTFTLSGQPSWLKLSGAGLLSGTPTAVPALPVTITVTVTDSIKATGVASYPLTIDPAVTVTPRLLTPATVGNDFSAPLTVAGGSGSGYTLTPSGLPLWLTLSPDNVLQGAPTTAGTYSFHILVTDSNGATTNQAYSLTVHSALVVNPATLPIATVGDNLSVHLTGKGGSGKGYLFTSTNLPSWLTLTSAGVLSGMPTDASDSPLSFTVMLTDSNNATGSTNYTLTIDPALTFTPTTLPMATAGMLISVPLTASGGSGAGYVFTGSGLPSWLRLSSAGVLSGTPPASTVGLSFNFTVKVTDSIRATGSAVCTLTV